MKQLTAYDFKRYERQIKLPEVGGEGQKKLKNARILCIGAGGLASPLLQYLVAAGVETIGIVDPDVVELSNLHRQIIYTESDIGEPKVEAAKRFLRRLNPHLKCDIHHDFFSEANALEIISNYDFVADCTDSLACRYLTNDACFSLGVPFVFAGISGYFGQIGLFAGRTGPCFRCLFANPHALSGVPDCNIGGVLGVLPGVVGTLQATMLIAAILDLDASLRTKFFQFDLLSFRFQEYSMLKNEECSICSRHRSATARDQVEIYREFSSVDLVDIENMSLSHAIFQLLDVRTFLEHDYDNIGGIAMPLEELSSRMDEIDSSIPVIVYCHSGQRSILACRQLARAGYTKLSFLRGGISAKR
jgi:adenylyltransferase/sulfurtransferase